MNKQKQQFNIDNWIRQNKFKAKLINATEKKPFLMFKASVISIIFGLLLGIIIIGFNKYNGFKYIFEIFRNALSTQKYNNGAEIYKTINLFSAYAILALGLAMAFRINIFNIGASGQAVLGAGISTFILGKYLESLGEGKAFPMSNPGFLVLCLLIFMLCAITLSVLAGVLKSFFNIHEVVTTVIFNWILWYFVKWLLTRPSYIAKHPLFGTQTMQLPMQWVNIFNQPWVLGIILVVLAFASIFLVTRFTVFGYKFKVVSNSKDAAIYSGFNYKLYIVFATMISGALIGVASFIYYFTIARSLDFGVDQLPLFGFDGISIALVAFNSEIGIIPIAFLWACLNIGSTLAIAAPEFQSLTAETAQLMMGAIIYGAAISALFFKFRPIRNIKFEIFKLKDCWIREYTKQKNAEIKTYRSQLWKLKNDEELTTLKNNYLAFEKNSEDYKKAQIEYKIALLNKKKALRSLIKVTRKDIEMEAEHRFKLYRQSGVNGAKYKAKQDITNEKLATLNELLYVAISRDEKIENLRHQLKNTNEEAKKLAIKDQITTMKNTINEMGHDSIKALNQRCFEINTKRDEAIIFIKKEYEKLDLEYKEKINSASTKEEKFELKKQWQNKKMEVSNGLC